MTDDEIMKRARRLATLWAAPTSLAQIENNIFDALKDMRRDTIIECAKIAERGPYTHLPEGRDYDKFQDIARVIRALMEGE